MSLQRDAQSMCGGRLEKRRHQLPTTLGWRQRKLQKPSTCVRWTPALPSLAGWLRTCPGVPILLHRSAEAMLTVDVLVAGVSSCITRWQGWLSCEAACSWIASKRGGSKKLRRLNLDLGSAMQPTSISCGQHNITPCTHCARCALQPVCLPAYLGMPPHTLVNPNHLVSMSSKPAM